MLDRAFAPAFDKRLGRRMYTQNIVLRGRLDADEWKAFLSECIAAMGMISGGDAAAWEYPTPDGRGGRGITVVQPMTESFIVVDAWPDHDGAYLHISSCRKFDVADLVKPVKSFGLGVELLGLWEALRLA